MSLADAVDVLQTGLNGFREGPIYIPTVDIATLTALPGSGPGGRMTEQQYRELGLWLWHINNLVPNLKNDRSFQAQTQMVLACGAPRNMSWRILSHLYRQFGDGHDKPPAPPIPFEPEPEVEQNRFFAPLPSEGIVVDREEPVVVRDNVIVNTADDDDDLVAPPVGLPKKAAKKKAAPKRKAKATKKKTTRKKRVA